MVLWEPKRLLFYWILKGPNINREASQVCDEGANSQSAGNMDFDYLNRIPLYFYQAQL